MLILCSYLAPKSYFPFGTKTACVKRVFSCISLLWKNNPPVFIIETLWIKNLKGEKSEIFNQAIMPLTSAQRHFRHNEISSTDDISLEPIQLHAKAYENNSCCEFNNILIGYLFRGKHFTFSVKFANDCAQPR